MLQRDARAVDLALVGLAAQLPGQLAALGQAGGAERVALGDQAARRVDDRAVAAVGGGLRVDELVALALLGQAERLVGDQLVRAEAVVQLDDVDLVDADRRLLQRAAKKAMDEAQVSIEDVDVIELHDCFSANELITYEALGLAEEGHGHELVENEDTTYGGRWVVNPSGGLISKGHPLGATGLAQCSELTWQLRGTADARQVDGATVALQHNIGLGGAAVVTVYRQAA